MSGARDSARGKRQRGMTAYDPHLVVEIWTKELNYQYDLAPFPRFSILQYFATGRIRFADSLSKRNVESGYYAKLTQTYNVGSYCQSCFILILT